MTHIAQAYGSHRESSLPFTFDTFLTNRLSTHLFIISQSYNKQTHTITYHPQFSSLITQIYRYTSASYLTASTFICHSENPAAFSHCHVGRAASLSRGSSRARGHCNQLQAAIFVVRYIPWVAQNFADRVSHSARQSKWRSGCCLFGLWWRSKYSQHDHHPFLLSQ